jgi:hypothetical protein
MKFKVKLRDKMMRKLFLILSLIFVTLNIPGQQRPEFPRVLQEYCKSYVPKVHVNVPIKSASDYSNIIYIDPGYRGVSTGSLTQPFKSWDDITFRDNTAYLQKRGTKVTLSASRTLTNRILLGAYGEGDRPVIEGKDLDSYYMFRFAGNDNIIRDLQLVSAKGGRQYHGVSSVYAALETVRSARNVIYNNVFIRASIVSWSTHLRILNNDVYYTSKDGIFLENSDFVEVGNNRVIRPNQSYHEWTGAGTCPEAVCTGDAILMHYVTNWYVYNNFLLRDDTGNKFAFISNSGGNGLIECNTMVGPSQPGFGNAILYLGENQENITIRYNHLIGPASRVLYTHAPLSFNNNVVQGVFRAGIYSDDNRAKIGNNTFDLTPVMTPESTGEPENPVITYEYIEENR